MRRALVDALAKASGMPADVIDANLSRPKDLKRGDLAFPCFLLAKEWKAAPPQCAARLAEQVELPSGFDRLEVVGPYLNFFLDRRPEIRRILESIMERRFPLSPAPVRPETVLIDYSHPNIAKPFHVGHMRTTLIGLSLDRLHRHLGYQVQSINHLGDWGTQFGLVYAGCQLWGKPEQATVDQLVDLYIRASGLRKAQDEQRVPPEDSDKPPVYDIARSYFLRLEQGEPEAVAFWRWCRDISLEYFKQTYERLGIHFDHYTGEAFYQDQLAMVEQKIRACGILQESRGALGVDLGADLGFARVFAEDGRSLYITRDIAAALYREQTFHPLKILYVVAAAQTLHFKQLVAVLERMNEPVAKKILHIAFGFVPGMSTRAGGAISLADFLNEAHERALKAYREEVTKRPPGLDEEQIAEAVAIGATYFYFLSHSNTKDFNFSWDEALNFQGDSGPYVQYALARINSIEAKAGEAGIAAAADFAPELLGADEPYELVTVLGRFAQVVEKMAEEYEPYYLAQYLVDVARLVSRSYNSLRVVGEERELARARLTLFICARNVLAAGMQLLGMPVIERM